MSRRGENSVLSIEKQTLLRRCFDAGMPKNKAMKRVEIAEATVYRYYAKWQAEIDAADGQSVFNFKDLHPSVLIELKVQATMRRLTLYNFVLNMLTVVAQDNLSKSIVDIEEDHPKKKRLANNG